MKWAIIGAGGIADRRAIPALLKDDSHTLVAIMERRAENAERIGKKYNVPYFTNVDEMLSCVDCDAVYIGTPVTCHFDQAMASLRYGKHVFLEKPVAMNGEESEKLVDAFKKAGKQITIGYMMKYHNLHEKAKTLIKNGEIGQVNSIRAQFTCWYPDIAGAWRQTKALGGGGAIMDLGVHCIELVQDVLNEEITDVKAFYSTHTFSYEVEDGAVIIFKTQSGVLGHIDVNFNIPDKASVSKLEIYGSKGYILCQGTLGQEEKGVMSHLYAPQGGYEAMQTREESKPTQYLGAGEDLYEKQLNVFREIVESGTCDYFYADRAVRVQKIVDEIYNNNG